MSAVPQDDEPAEGLRRLDQLQVPDSRMRFLAVREGGWVRSITQQDRHEVIAAYDLNPAVPEDIRVQFDTARNLYLYAWNVYRFHVVAEHQALATLELALRTRLISANVLDAKGKHTRTLAPKVPGGPPRSETRKAMLSDLLKLAAHHGYLRNSWLENKHGWAMLLARERQSMELSRKMFDLGLTEMDVPDEEPVPTTDELAFDWIGHFTETLPSIRNNYAHGSTSLHTTVLRTFEVTRAFVNQLFVGAPSIPG